MSQAPGCPRFGLNGSGGQAGKTPRGGPAPHEGGQHVQGDPFPAHISSRAQHTPPEKRACAATRAKPGQLQCGQSELAPQVQSGGDN